MKVWICVGIILAIGIGCCNCGKQEDTHVDSVKTSPPKQNQQKSATPEQTKEEMEETREKEKEEQFAKDVQWIYNFTLQQGYNPAAEDQVVPQDHQPKETEKLEETPQNSKDDK